MLIVININRYVYFNYISIMINYLKGDIEKLKMKKKILTDQINSREKYETEKELKALTEYQGIKIKQN